MGSVMVNIANSEKLPTCLRSLIHKNLYKSIDAFSGNSWQKILKKVKN
jgi:hypothetical protein